MGIKNLLKFLSEQQDIVKKINIKDYYGKKIAIDISILIYQFVIAIRNTGADLTNSKGELTSHILGLFNKTINFLEKGIIPVYVFDGKPPHLKKKVIDARKQVKRRAIERLQEAETIEEKIKCLKRSVTITKTQMNQCRELLKLMGIPYVDSPEEADSELSYLCRENMVYAVLTEDMDILTFGSPRIIRNLSSNKKIPIEIELTTTLDKLNINYEEFIELCILFGCDYCPHLNDISVTKIYETFIKYKCIDKTIDRLKLDGYNIPYNFEYKEAKKYFIDYNYSPVLPENLKLKKPDTDALLQLLVNKYGLVKFKLINKINRLLVHYNNFKDI
jgi:flap endonuclease-1